MKIFTPLIILLSLFLSSALFAQAQELTDTLKKGSNYYLFNQSEGIKSVNFKYNKKKEEQFIIQLSYPAPPPPTNTIQGAIQGNKTKADETSSVPVFEKIEILEGGYEDITVERGSSIRNKFTFSGLKFPLHLRLICSKGTVELKLLEAGNWTVGIELKNN